MRSEQRNSTPNNFYRLLPAFGKQHVYTGQHFQNRTGMGNWISCQGPQIKNINHFWGEEKANTSCLWWWCSYFCFCLCRKVKAATHGNRIFTHGDVKSTFLDNSWCETHTFEIYRTELDFSNEDMLLLTNFMLVDTLTHAQSAWDQTRICVLDPRTLF